MRILCAALLAAFLPVLAHAAALKEGKDWRYCSTDDQCVMIDGLCDKTAVNALVKDKAEAFYKQERPGAKCVERFWRSGEKMPRCRLGGCETIPKQASDRKAEPLR